MKNISEMSLTEKVMQAMTDAVAEVIAEHQRTGRPLATWKNGEAIWVQAENARSCSTSRAGSDEMA